jgi:hypothetical protein
MKESQAQSKILNCLRKYGWFYKASDRFRAGIPDIIGCYKGHFIAVEMKVDYNKPSKLQEYEMTAIADAKGSVYVVTYSNRERLYRICHEKFKTAEETVSFILRLAPSTTSNSALT